MKGETPERGVRKPDSSDAIWQYRAMCDSDSRILVQRN